VVWGRSPEWGPAAEGVCGQRPQKPEITSENSIILNSITLFLVLCVLCFTCFIHNDCLVLRLDYYIIIIAVD